MPELPFEIWKDRVENELKAIKKLEVLEENTLIRANNSVEFTIKLNELGVIKQNGDFKPKKSHRIFLKINRSFPYPGGIDFSWLTNIFHPNIHPVGLSLNNPGTGYICLNVLKKWSRLSDLKTTVKALGLLVKNPNPDDPLNYPICLEAADFFRKKTMADFLKDLDLKEIVVEEEEEDDDIIIVDD